MKVQKGVQKTGLAKGVGVLKAGLKGVQGGFNGLQGVPRMEIDDFLLISFCCTSLAH